MTMTNPKRLIAAQAFNAGQKDDYESFEEWESNEIVSFTCNDCNKDVYLHELQGIHEGFTRVAASGHFEAEGSVGVRGV